MNFTIREHPMAPPVPHVGLGPEEYYYDDFAEDDEIVEVVAEVEKKTGKDKSSKNKSSGKDEEPVETSLIAYTFKKAPATVKGVKPTWEYATKRQSPFGTKELAKELRKYERTSSETPKQAYDRLTPFQQDQMDRILAKQETNESNINAAWTFANIRKEMKVRNKSQETVVIHVMLKRHDKRELEPSSVLKPAQASGQAKPRLPREEIESIYAPLSDLSLAKDKTDDVKRYKKEKNAMKQSQESIIVAPDTPNRPIIQHVRRSDPQNRMQPPHVAVPPPMMAQLPPQIQGLKPHPPPHMPPDPPQDAWAPHERRYLPTDPVTNPFAPGFKGGPQGFGMPPIARPNVEIPPLVRQTYEMPPPMREAQPPQAPQPELNLNPPYPADRGFMDQLRATTMPGIAQDRRPEQRHPDYSRNQPGMDYGQKVQEWETDSYGPTDSDHWRDHSSNEGAAYPSTPSTSMSPEPYANNAWPPQERGYHQKYGHGRHDSGYQGGNTNNHHPGPTMHPIRTPRHEELPRHNGPTQRYSPAQIHNQQQRPQPQPRPQDRDRERDSDDRDRPRRPDGRYDSRPQRQRPRRTSSSSSLSGDPHKTSLALEKIAAHFENIEREKREVEAREKAEAERNDAYAKGHDDARREFLREQQVRMQQQQQQQRPPLLHSQSLGVGAGFGGAGGYGDPAGYATGGGGGGGGGGRRGYWRE